MKIVLNIKEIAIQKGYTRTTLARHADVQYSTVNKLWKSPDTEVTLLVLLKIAAVLDTSITDLYEVYL